VTSEHERSYDPPRRPLRVHVTARQSLDDGTTLVARGWRILEPNELEYDVAYQEAARAHRIYGWDMPYADASEEEEEVISQGSGRQETGRDRPTRFK